MAQAGAHSPKYARRTPTISCWPAAILEVNTDITQRRAADEILREQAGLLNLVPDAVLVCDFNTGRIEPWNRGPEALYGWREPEALGKLSHELRGTQLARDAGELRAELLDTGHWEGEVEHVARDGRRLIVSSRWALRRGDDGQPRDILVISTDIMERRRAERKLSRLAAAEAALQERDQLLATVSHDLKTPLKAIRSQADILLRQIDRTGNLDIDRTERGSSWRSDYRRRHRKVRLRLAELLAGGPDAGPGRAEDLYSGLCAEDPDDERLWTALLRIYEPTGNVMKLDSTVRRLQKRACGTPGWRSRAR